MKSISITTRLLYLILSIGFILFLGSLFSFIVLNIIGEEPTVTSAYWKRLFVAKMTNTITIPGLILIVIGVLWVMIKDHPFLKRWAIAAQVLLALLTINTAFVVIPTVYAVNDLSLQQLCGNTFLDNYVILKTKEDMLGAFNMLMAIGLFLIVIFQVKLNER